MRSWIHTARAELALSTIHTPSAELEIQTHTRELELEPRTRIHAGWRELELAPERTIAGFKFLAYET